MYMSTANVLLYMAEMSVNTAAGIRCLHENEHMLPSNLSSRVEASDNYFIIIMIFFSKHQPGG